jgi:hypothetical protein
MSIRNKENTDTLVDISTTNGVIVISGASNNVITVTKDLSGDLSVKRYFYDIHNDTDDKCIQDGRLFCDYSGR